MKTTHIAFSDDSSHQDGRYNSLALVSLERSNSESVHKNLREILCDSGIKSEFKWVKLKSAKYKFAAQKLIDFIFQYNIKIRIDVLTWDYGDSRHKNIIGRDDSENLVRMYYHLASATFSKRWPIENSFWGWHPDIQSSVDWNVLQDCIRNKKHPCIRDLFIENPNFSRVELRNIKPSDSKNHPFIQVADLFAGMGAYSWGHFKRFSSWKEYNSGQIPLFYEKQKLSFSNSERVRFEIIDQFNMECKKLKMGIAFEHTMGFQSYNPREFINFWLYKPQHASEKAPKKG